MSSSESRRISLLLLMVLVFVEETRAYSQAGTAPSDEVLLLSKREYSGCNLFGACYSPPAIRIKTDGLPVEAKIEQETRAYSLAGAAPSNEVSLLSKRIGCNNFGACTSKNTTKNDEEAKILQETLAYSQAGTAPSNEVLLLSKRIGCNNFGACYSVPPEIIIKNYDRPKKEKRGQETRAYSQAGTAPSDEVLLLSKRKFGNLFGAFSSIRHENRTRNHFLPEEAKKGQDTRAYSLAGAAPLKEVFLLSKRQICNRFGGCKSAPPASSKNTDALPVEATIAQVVDVSGGQTAQDLLRPLIYSSAEFYQKWEANYPWDDSLE